MPRLRNNDWRRIEFPEQNLVFEPGGELEVSDEVADLLGGSDLFPTIETVGGPPPPIIPPVENEPAQDEGDPE